MNMILPLPSEPLKRMSALTTTGSSSSSLSSPSSMDEFHSRCIFIINTRSGGRTGWLLGEELKYNGCKVYDLLELHELDKVKAEFASDISSRNCVVGICGGDGSIAWGCSVVSDALRFAPPGKQIFPTITVVPIGTGNDLSRSLGWGNQGIAPRSIAAFLDNLKRCHESKRIATLDRWKMRVHTNNLDDVSLFDRAQSPSSHDSSTKPDEIDGFHATEEPVPDVVCNTPDEDLDSDEDSEWRYAVMNEFSPVIPSSFLCYMSVGYDARVAFEFQQERFSHPERFRSQFGNQMVYIKYGFNELFKPSDEINDDIVLEIDGEVIELPPRTRSLKFVNINSAASGVFFWGHGPSRAGEFEEFHSPRLDDGRIEVMATRGVTDLIANRVNMAHAHRLGQGRDIKLRILKDSGIALQVDGEGYMIEPGCIHISRLDSLPTLIGFDNPRGVFGLDDGDDVDAEDSARVVVHEVKEDIVLEEQVLDDHNTTTTTTTAFWSLETLEWFRMFKLKLESTSNPNNASSASGNVKRYHSTGMLLNEKEIDEFQKMYATWETNNNTHDDGDPDDRFDSPTTPPPIDIEEIVDFSSVISHPVDI